MLFDHFIKSDARNSWCTWHGIDLFVRRVKRIEHDTTIDLANIRASHAGQGRFGRFLDTYEPTQRFYIENVMNVRFADYLERRGYNRIGHHYPYSYCR